MQRTYLYIIIVIQILLPGIVAYGQQPDTTQPVLLNEIVVSADKPNDNVVRPEMSVEKLAARQIKLIPALFGEVDVIKAIQLLPGVQAASEGSSGFSVRGGSPGQNLILFDDAVVYNASHLMGFFSVFNNDAVDGITLYKGDIPAAYGGRISSLLEVDGKPGSDQFALNAGIGLIASRLMVQGPIVPGKINFLVAGRRTYADMFLPLAPEKNIRNATLYFYDLNTKLHARLDRKNQLSFTGYYGADSFGNHNMGMDFGNMTGTLRWKNFTTDDITIQVELLGSGYNYSMLADMQVFSGEWKSKIYDVGLRADLTYRHGQSTYRFGVSSNYKWFTPGEGAALIEGQNYEIAMDRKYTWENALYFENKHQLFERLTLKYGLRGTRFDNIGPSSEYCVNNNYEVTDTLNYNKSRSYHHRWGFEPRVGLTYAFNDRMSAKASYARTRQFLHLLSMSTAGSPLDVWVPSNLSIKPETADQYAVGIFTNFMDNLLETSLEVYYKRLTDLIDFKDHAQVIENKVVEKELRTGTGENYGIECMLRKNTGDLTGWISYTWSRAFRTVPGINNGQRYASPYDRPHNLNIVLSYTFTPRLSASVNWIYVTGQPVTFPEARYMFDNDYIPVYTARNTYRMPDYHRLDASLDLRLGKDYPGKKWRHALNISVYNLYGRKNPWTINFQTDDAGAQYAEMTYLFSIVPSVTYTVSFN